MKRRAIAILAAAACGLLYLLAPLAASRSALEPLRPFENKLCRVSIAPEHEGSDRHQITVNVATGGTSGYTYRFRGAILVEVDGWAYGPNEKK